MRLLDPKFRNNKLRYAAQCVLATMLIFVVLLVLDTIANAAVIASLGASTFIVFAMPYAQVSRPRYLIGGYLVGVLCGAACHYISLWPAVAALPVVRDSAPLIFGSIAVGLSIFIMVIMDFEHPPAAGAALGLVLGDCNAWVVLVIVLGISALATIRTVVRPYLIQLL